MNKIKKPLRLKCVAQNYDWGMCGMESLVARLAGITDKNIPAAEFWMGMHPNGSSQVFVEGAWLALSQLVEESAEEILGREVLSRFGKTLPFLFKVLSIAKPLSIQAHPDKNLAGVLHKKDPKNYPDSNHKPEMAIALSEVSLLYGFRPLAEIVAFINSVPELKSLLSDSLVEKLGSHGTGVDADTFLIASIIQELCRLDPAIIKPACKKLFHRLATNPQLLREEDRLVLGLESNFPEGDIGLFFFYLLNLRRLYQGEAIFIGPNIPHAYLGGHLLECMANSDNVLRAGLTSKFKDLTALEKMLDFQPRDLEYVIPIKSEWADAGLSFFPPAEEFSVDYFFGSDKSDKNVSLTLDGAAILLVLAGKVEIRTASGRTEVASGEVVLLPACMEAGTISYQEAQAYLARSFFERR